MVCERPLRGGRASSFLRWWSVSGLWLVLVAVYGACAGSYLAVVVDRVPAGRGLTGGPNCGAYGGRLRIVDNVPVLAYLRPRGRCSRCRTRIPPLWWLLEVVTAAAWVVCAALLGPRVLLTLVLLGMWLVLLKVGLRLARRQESLSAAIRLPTIGLFSCAAAAGPAAAVAAQVVAPGAAVDQRWAVFTALGATGAAGLVAAVLVAPRGRPDGPNLSHATGRGFS